MKVISFHHKGKASYGALEGDRVADFGAKAGAAAPDLKTAIAKGMLAELKAGTKADIALGDVEQIPVIPNPDKILCVGLNYEAHRIETGRPVSKYPTIFTRFADTQIANGQALILPPESSVFDYEGELAVVIGKRGRRISEADALAHVAGYSCYNDGSIRDWQQHQSQFTPGKNFPGTGAFGPWLVTTDEIPDPQALTLTTRLNGQVVQTSPTSDMMFSVAKIIAYLSSFTPLSPGDVIATGTPGGVGFTRKPPLLMKDGDVAEVEISGIGILRNPVAAERR